MFYIDRSHDSDKSFKIAITSLGKGCRCGCARSVGDRGRAPFGMSPIMWVLGCGVPKPVLPSTDSSVASPGAGTTPMSTYSKPCGKVFSAGILWRIQKYFPSWPLLEVRSDH